MEACGLYMCICVYCPYADHMPITTGAADLLLQLIFVRRGDQESRDYTVSEIRRRAESKGDWPHVLIYPEGMCMYTGGYVC